jgi:uncharacterized membrane protein YhhN
MSARPRWLSPHLWWWAAVVAGVSYYAPAFLGWHGPIVIAWKGAGVGLLAVYAAMSARVHREITAPRCADAVPEVASHNAWWLAAIMACGAMGDVLLDAVSMVVGAAWFALAHVLSMVLYWRNRRTSAGASRFAKWLQAWPFWFGVPVSLALTALLAHGDPLADVAIGYTLLVALMAAFAWRSRFSRKLVGLGAFLFLVSDLLIFTRAAGPETLREVAGLLVWPLYFGGQALIARGVIRGPQPN